MKKILTAAVTAILIACTMPAARAATIIYHENFTGSSASNLNGTVPDVDNNGGSNTWAAATAYKLDGTTPAGSVNTGAFLPFTPVAGNVYALSASFTGVGPDGTNVAWHAVGFGKGMPTTSLDSGSENRFVSGATVGRTWMLFRPNNPTTPTDSPNVNHRGNATAGTGPAGTAQNWTDSTLARAEGGDMDLQIVLDTNPAVWTATYYAKRSADSSYTLVSGGPLNLLVQDIGVVGIARSTNTAGSTAMTGKVTSFDLSLIPEPATSVLLALGAMVLGAATRRKQ